jgi:phage gp46-like protein
MLDRAIGILQAQSAVMIGILDDLRRLGFRRWWRDFEDVRIGKQVAPVQKQRRIIVADLP